MNIDRISALKQVVGDQTITVLTGLFDQSTGCPPGIRADRYRADHPEWLDILDRLESAQLFLRRQQENPGNYQLTIYALPLVESERSKRYLQIMDVLYVYLQSFYRERLSDQLPVAELIEKAKADDAFADEDIKDALFYMTEGPSIWSGKSQGFPYANNCTLCVSEFVLRHPTLISTIDQFYDWHILNPRNIVAADFNLSDPDNQDGVRSSFFRQAEIAQPDWYEELDDHKKALIAEIDSALHSDLSSLPTMGLRALLELIVLDHIADQGTFKGNLKEFVKQGFMTHKQADLVSSVVDAGNAAVHRAYFPNQSDILLCVDVVKHLAQGVYILGPLVNAMASKTPPRPDK